MKPVIILPESTPQKTVQKFEKAGYITILCDHPEKVQITTATNRITGDDMFMMAMGVWAKLLGDEQVRNSTPPTP